MTNVTNLSDTETISEAEPAPDFAPVLMALAAKVQHALNHRDRAETSVIVATLALDGQLSDFDWRIAQALRSGAWDGLSEVYADLQEAMALIPENYRPEGFRLDEGVSHG